MRNQRLRETCHWEVERGSVSFPAGTRVERQGPGAATSPRQCGRSPSEVASARPGRNNLGLEVNRVVLSGLIVEDPQRDKSRDGDPVTVLLVSFAAPDEKVHWGWACCEIEVPDGVAEPQRTKLRVGAPILVSGEMTGVGGVWADLIVTEEGETPDISSMTNTH